MLPDTYEDENKWTMVINKKQLLRNKQSKLYKKPYYPRREKIQFDMEVDYLFYTKKTAVSCVEFVLRGE